MTPVGTESGMLFLVATPIGNLADITLRAVETLKKVDWVAVEDTRRARILLKHYDISATVELYHDRNQSRKTPRLIKLLQSGQSGALITDAGTPGIADPGFTLVRSALAAGIDVRPIPGPVAAVAAITVSGLPCDRFVFEGYLPRTPAKRRRRLEALSADERTVVFYLSPHRYLSDLREILKRFGDRRACLAREMTKVYEEFRYESLAKLLEDGEGRTIKGELTLVVAGIDRKQKQRAT